MDGWNNFSFPIGVPWDGLFSGANLLFVSGRVTYPSTWSMDPLLLRSCVGSLWWPGWDAGDGVDKLSN